MSISRTVLSLATLLVLASCSSTKQVSQSEPAKGRWLTPSPLLRSQLQDEADQLPYVRSIERLELIRWFAGVGEPAYETLLGLLSDPRDEVAAASFAALGITGDRRLVDSIRAADWEPIERTHDLKLERARTLVRLGDWREIPMLIEGLSDERRFTRRLAITALLESTGEDLGYDEDSTETSREIAIAAWERWWLKYSGDPLR